jgi:hypothetical protein
MHGSLQRKKDVWDWVGNDGALLVRKSERCALTVVQVRGTRSMNTAPGMSRLEHCLHEQFGCRHGAIVRVGVRVQERDRSRGWQFSMFSSKK